MAASKGGKAAGSKGAKAPSTARSGTAKTTAPRIDAEGAKSAVVEAHRVIQPKQLEGLEGVPDTVSQIIGPMAKAKPVVTGPALTYRVLQRSYMPKDVGGPHELVEAGETVVYDGKPGSNLELVGGPAPAAEAPSAAKGKTKPAPAAVKDAKAPPAAIELAPASEDPPV